MRIITLLLFLTALLTAQEGEHTCRTLFLNGPQQAPGKYYLFDGRSSQEVALPRLSFSPVYKLAPNSSALVNEPAGKLEKYPLEGNFRVPGDERTDPALVAHCQLQHLADRCVGAHNLTQRLRFYRGTRQ